jgi:pimeloyl-ACP methyl ester carboxylesterase
MGRIASEFDRDAFARSVLLWLFTPRLVIEQPEVLDTIEQLILAEPPRPETFNNQIAAVHGHDTREQLAQIEAPTLVMTARRDFMVPPELGEAVHKAIPGSRLETLDGGHAFSAENAAEFNRVILEFLQAN